MPKMVGCSQAKDDKNRARGSTQTASTLPRAFLRLCTAMYRQSGKTKSVTDTKMSEE